MCWGELEENKSAWIDGARMNDAYPEILTAGAQSRWVDRWGTLWTRTVLWWEKKGNIMKVLSQAGGGNGLCPPSPPLPVKTCWERQFCGEASAARTVAIKSPIGLF